MGKRNQRRKKKRKMNDMHAAIRLCQRYPNADVTMAAVKREVQMGRVEFLHRQTVTRSVAQVTVHGTVVYLVLARPNMGIVTVLSPEQAQEWYGSSASSQGLQKSDLEELCHDSSST